MEKVSVVEILGKTILGDVVGRINYPALKDGACDEGRTYRKPHIESSSPWVNTDTEQSDVAARYSQSCETGVKSSDLTYGVSVCLSETNHRLDAPIIGCKESYR